MSALQLAWVWAADEAPGCWPEDAGEAQKFGRAEHDGDEEGAADPPIALAFYRKHTERILRRYLYASMQVGRAP